MVSVHYLAGGAWESPNVIPSKLVIRGTEDPPLTSRYYVKSIPPEFRVRAGFDSDRCDCGDRNGMGACLLPGSLLFYFAS